MRENLDFDALEQVVGGCVNLSKSKMKIGFTTLQEGYDLKCTFEEARDLLYKLFAENDTTEAKFDQIVKDTFLAKGWI